MIFHPASLLLLWGVGVAVLQCLTLKMTLLATVLLFLFAILFSKALFLRLLSRSRWLFLTMALLFLWLTPGVRLPSPWGGWGMTWEGVEFALEHMGRLATMLALLALLLTRLSHRGIVSGLYFLLAPLGRAADLRRAVAVRLMLTLEAVGGRRGNEWRSLLVMETANISPDSGATSLQLPLAAWSWRDSTLILTTLAAAMLLLWGWGRS